MESFLDRLLAQDAAAPRRPPARPRRRRAPAGPSARRAQAVRRVLSRSPPPQGPGAPRIAVYDTLTSPPRVIDVEEKDVPALIASLAEKTYHSCREQGGTVPYTVITELIENLIHARFRDVVITILDGGRIVRISDHGPGVADKERAFEPGFTTATADQRRFIRGVGSGLPMARESLAFLSGVVTVEDNLGGGSVVTVKMPQQAACAAPPQPRRGPGSRSSRSARSASSPCSWRSTPPDRRSSPRSSTPHRRRPIGSFIYWTRWAWYTPCATGSVP